MLPSPPPRRSLPFAWTTCVVVLGAIGLTFHTGHVSAANSPSGAIETLFRSSFETGEQHNPILFDTARPQDADELGADAVPEVSINFAPDIVDPASVRLFVNGIDVTALAQVDALGVRYTPAQAFPEGRQQVEVHAGTSQHGWTFLTASAPLVTALAPVETTLPAGARPTISASFSDVGSGIDPARTRLYLMGGGYSDADVTSQATVTESGITFTFPEPLTTDVYYVEVDVFDRAGNAGLGQTLGKFQVGAAPEFLSIEPGPDEVLLPFGTQKQIRVRFNSGGAPLLQHAFSVDGEEVVASLQDHGDDTYTLSHVITDAAAREHCFGVTVTNTATLTSNIYRCFKVDIERVREIEILSPAQDSVFSADRIEVRVRATDDGRPVEDVVINGIGALIQRDRSVTPAVYGYHVVDEVPLAPGENLIDIEVHFENGAVTNRQLRVRRVEAPTVQIDSPADWAILGPLPPPVPEVSPTPGGAMNLTGNVQRPVTILGSTSAPVASVRINQQQAVLAGDGLSFTFPNFFLHEGTNLISATATDPHGRTVDTQITVYVDQTAPILTLEYPVPDTAVSTQTLDLRGIVNDAVEGRVGAPQPQVHVVNTMNGIRVDASVTRLGFLAKSIPLEIGANLLTVTAMDHLGNQRDQTVRVVRTLAGSPSLLLMSGGGQHATAGTELAEPFVVQAVGPNGEPLVDHPVRFDVLRGSGSVRAGAVPERPDGVSPARSLDVRTDTAGFARVWLRLGHDARPGSDMVRASIVGRIDGVTITATAESGAAHRIGLFGSAGAQYVSTHSTPVEALMAQVLDAQDNSVSDVRVEFRIVSGDAFFDSGSAPDGDVAPDGNSIVTRTDRHGVAAARPRTGADPGTVSVRAEILHADGSRTGQADFQLETLERRSGATALSGTVMDHDGTPLAGIQMSVGRTALTATTDADGFFSFQDQVPPGKIDLFVDGRAVQFTRGGASYEYPALHFETAVIQGQVNQLPHPIFLPPVEISRTVIVGGDEDVRLTIPGFEGFEMIVRANSVTFPDGSRIGPLVVSAVHADRLPMVPPGLAGTFAGLGWTIQPTNTRFDPPIQVFIPNTEGLARGRTLPIFQWDHDLAAFVPMGQGTVSEDGTRIVSDAGSGITKAGWGGGGPPPPPPNDGDNQCEAERSTQSASLSITIDGNAGNVNEKFERRGNSYRFQATIAGECKKPDITWTLEEGVTKRGKSVGHKFEKPGVFPIRASATCDCGNTVAPAEKELRLFCDLSELDRKVKIEKQRHVIKPRNDIDAEDALIFTSYLRDRPRQVKFLSGLLEQCADEIEGGWKIEGNDRGAGDVETALQNAGLIEATYKIENCDICEPRSFDREFKIHTCTVTDIKNASRDFLSPLPRSHRERGATIECTDGAVELKNEQDSPEDDYCKVRFTAPKGKSAGLPHRHPFFVTNADVVGDHCRSIVASANGDLPKANKAQQNVSDGDRDAARSIQGFTAVGWAIGCQTTTEGVTFWDPIDGDSSIFNRGSPRCRAASAGTPEQSSP